MSGGASLAGATILFLREGAGVEGAIPASSREDGTFTARLAPGAHHVLVRLPTTGDEWEMPRVVPLAPVDVPLPPESERLVLRLPEGRIEGRLLAAPVDPAEELFVRARRSSATSVAPFETGTLAARVATDGSFAFDLLAPGTWLLSGDAPSAELVAPEVRVEVSGDVTVSDVELQLTAGRTLQVALPALTADEQAVAEFYLRAADGGPVHQVVKLDNWLLDEDMGPLLLLLLPQGEHELLAVHAGRASAWHRVTPAGDGEQRPYALQLEPAGTLVVTDLRDTPAPLELVDAGGRSVDAVLWAGGAWSSASEVLGRSRRAFGPLPPGQYTLRTIDEEGAERTSIVELIGDRETVLELR